MCSAADPQRQEFTLSISREKWRDAWRFKLSKAPIPIFPYFGLRKLKLGSPWRLGKVGVLVMGMVTWKAGPWHSLSFQSHDSPGAWPSWSACLPPCRVTETLSHICSVTVGICGAPAGGLQSEQQRPHWAVGHRGGHCHGHRHQPGDAEEETVRHHQPWDRGGEQQAFLCPELVMVGSVLSGRFMEFKHFNFIG